MDHLLNDSSQSSALTPICEGSTYENDLRPFLTSKSAEDAEYMTSCAILEELAFGRPADLPIEEEAEGPKTMD